MNKKAQKRRRYLRHSMCFPLSFSVVKNNFRRVSCRRGDTKNVGRGGFLFSARKEVKKGTLIKINIPFQSKLFKVKAQVVHCCKNDDVQLWDIGVKFIHPKESFKVKLIEQMYLISEYRDLLAIELGREVSLQEASLEWIKKYSERFSRLYW